MNNNDLLKLLYLYRKLCNLVPTKKGDVEMFDKLYKEYISRKNRKQGE